MTTPRGDVLAPFWADTFDMDLLALWPDLPAHLGPVARQTLWTHGHATHGRLNMPTVWNGYGRLEAYFGPASDLTGKPDSHWTDAPAVECTWLEVLRDWWVHGYAVIIAERVFLKPVDYNGLFYPIMADLRGWKTLTDDRRDKLRGHALSIITAATLDFGDYLWEDVTP